MPIALFRHNQTTLKTIISDYNDIQSNYINIWSLFCYIGYIFGPVVTSIFNKNIIIINSISIFIYILTLLLLRLIIILPKKKQKNKQKEIKSNKNKTSALENFKLLHNMYANLKKKSF